MLSLRSSNRRFKRFCLVFAFCATVSSSRRRLAHRHNLPVFAHPQDVDGMNVAIDSGVDVLAHTVPQSPPWTPEFVSRLKRANLAFMEAIYQHRGDRADRAFQDVDSATDFAVTRGWADPKRLCIFGWSAGGFVTAWTLTQTHRYRAAIEGAGVTDWSSFIWTSDIVQTDYDERWPDDDPEAFGAFLLWLTRRHHNTFVDSPRNQRRTHSDVSGA